LNGDSNSKRKGGRPKKSSVNLKSKTVGVCFSEPELHVIRYRAEKAELPLGVYCHDAILNGVIKESVKKADLEILRGLVNTGNNLNQMMKTSRFLNLKQLENESMNILESIKFIVNKLSDDWKNHKRKKF